MRSRRWEPDWGRTDPPEVGAQGSVPHSLGASCPSSPTHYHRRNPTCRYHYELRPLVIGATHYTSHKRHSFLGPAWSPRHRGFLQTRPGLPLTKPVGVVSEILQISTHLKGSLKSRFFKQWLFFRWGRKIKYSFHIFSQIDFSKEKSRHHWVLLINNTMSYLR